MQVMPETQETAFQQEKEPAVSGPVKGTEEQDSVVSSPTSADMDTVGKAPAVKKTRGRPVRYTNKSKVCRIPVELEDEVRAMLQIV